MSIPASPPVPDGRAFREAIHNGQGDPATALRNYLEEAEPRLAELLGRLDPSLEPDDLNFLHWLQATLISLLFASRERGGLYRIKFAKRAGNQARTSDEEERADIAALQVMTRVHDGQQQEQAIAEVSLETGVPRREIFRRLERFRQIGARWVSQNPGS